MFTYNVLLAVGTRGLTCGPLAPRSGSNVVVEDILELRLCPPELPPCVAVSLVVLIVLVIQFWMDSNAFCVPGFGDVPIG